MLTAVEPGTGKVRAMAVNRNFSLDESGNGPHTDPVKRRQGLTGTYPNTTNPLMSGGGDIFGYQSGSTAKIYTTIAALEQGLPLDHNIHAPHRVTTRFPVEPGYPSSCGNRWCPVNYPGQAAGMYNIWTGFGSSINTYFAQLIQQAGADNAVDVAQRLGVKFREPEDARLAANSAGWGAFTLGVAHTTPLDLANAYGTVSAEGIHCEPLPVEEIRTMDGESLDIASPRCRRAIDKDVALATIDAGRCVVGGRSLFGECRGGTARSVPGPGPGAGQATTSFIRQPLWGKTGTADGVRTYSVVLSTKQIAIAGQMADPDWADTDKSMISSSVQGAVMRTMRDAMDDRESRDWARPGNMKMVYGERVDIPDVTCMPVAEAEAALKAAGFEVARDEEPVDSECAEGEVAGTLPTGSTSKGSAVMIQISNGSDHEPDPDPTPGPPDGGDGGGSPGPPGRPRD
jgi:membrane peptidoglycan carboxypeptidase